MWSSERVNELTFQLNDSTPHQTLSGSQQPADQMHQRHFSLELQLQRDHLRPQLHLERWQEVVVVLEVHKLCALKQRKQASCLLWWKKRSRHHFSSSSDHVSPSILFSFYISVLWRQIICRYLFRCWRYADVRPCKTWHLSILRDSKRLKTKLSSLKFR